jgi:hypothetical protein
VNSSSGFQPRDARLKSTKIVSRATRGSRFYPFVELTFNYVKYKVFVSALRRKLSQKTVIYPGAKRYKAGMHGTSR